MEAFLMATSWEDSVSAIGPNIKAEAKIIPGSIVDEITTKKSSVKS